MFGALAVEHLFSVMVPDPEVDEAAIAVDAEAGRAKESR